MTVQTTTNTAVFTGNDVADEFSYSFYVADAQHLVVQRRVIATGLVDKTYTASEYTVSGIGSDNGSITLNAGALASTYQLLVQRIVPYKQELDVVNQGGFYPETVEQQLDEMVMQTQQLADQVERGIKVPLGESSIEVPTAAVRANRFPVWLSDGSLGSSAGTGADVGLRIDLGTAGGAGLAALSQGGNADQALEGVVNTAMVPGANFAERLTSALELAKGYAEAKIHRNPDAIHGYVAIPPGDYTLDEAITPTIDGSGMTNIAVVAAVPGTVRINIAAGIYAFEVTTYTDRVHFSGINFVGGKGAFRKRFAEVNVAGLHTFENCVFAGYTECAIASEVDDQPCWGFIGCQFWGETGHDTRGIALSGLVDDLLIDRCMFNLNQYHLVIGPIRSGGNVRSCSFLSFEDNRCDADVVIVPNNTSGASNAVSGSLIFDSCKFGNEGLNEAAPRFLFAAFNADGDGIENHTLSTSWITASGTANFIVGLCVKNCTFAVNGSYSAPLMRSYVDKVTKVRFAGNHILGGNFTYLVEWMGAHTYDYLGMWDVHLGPYSRARAHSAFPFTLGLSNEVMGPMLASVPGAEAITPHAPSGHAERSVLYAQVAADYAVGAGASKTAVAGPRGAADGTEVTVTAATTLGSPGTNYINKLVAGVSADNLDKAAWLTLSLKRHDTESVSRVQVIVKNGNSTATAHMGEYALPEKWGTICVPMTLPSAANTNWQVMVAPLDYAAGTGDKFLVGACHVNTGPAPMAAPPAGHITAIAAAAGANPTKAEFDALVTAFNTVLVQLERFGPILPA